MSLNVMPPFLHLAMVSHFKILHFPGVAVSAFHNRHENARSPIIIAIRSLYLNRTSRILAV